jgi:diketogulonate reductase-like aldo/keto reductase
MKSINGIPILGYGTWPLAGDECYRGVSMALELGIRHIDTAQNYGNEREVGRAIADSGVKRTEIFLVTKVAHDNLTTAKFPKSVAASLEALRCDYVDLLLIHWPPPEKSFDAMIDRLGDAHSRKQARMIGVSNFNIAMMRRAAARAGTPIVNNQVEFHPLLDQSRVKAEAEKLGMVLSAYSPLGRGAVLKDPVIIEIAGTLGRPPSEIALRWIIQQGVVALPMTTKRENAMSNLRALDFELSEDNMAAMTARTNQNRRLISPAGWAPKWDT